MLILNQNEKSQDSANIQIPRSQFPSARLGHEAKGNWNLFSDSGHKKKENVQHTVSEGWYPDSEQRICRLGRQSQASFPGTLGKESLRECQSCSHGQVSYLLLHQCSEIP